MPTIAQPASTPRGHPWRDVLIPFAITLAVGLLAVLYFTGRMDYALYPVGLNFHDCARNGFGATFCGSDLTQYERRVRGVQIQLQQAQQTITRDECQADPSLSICSQP